MEKLTNKLFQLKARIQEVFKHFKCFFCRKLSFFQSEKLQNKFAEKAVDYEASTAFQRSQKII